MYIISKVQIFHLNGRLNGMMPNLLPKYSKDLLEKNAMESTS